MGEHSRARAEPAHGRGSRREALRAISATGVARAVSATKTTLQSFPVRVWRHFLLHNGFVLSAGVSYQALFALFAVVYLAFAAVGVWLGASRVAIEGVIFGIDAYLPNLIAEEGVIQPEQVIDVVRGASALFSTTGVIALVLLTWTAVGWVTYARRAVRDIFTFPAVEENYALIKGRDVVGAATFGLLLVLGGVLSAAGTWVLGVVLDFFTIDDDTFAARALVVVATAAVVFAVDLVALWGLFTRLAGASVSRRVVIPGASLGAAGMVVLQVGAGVLLSATPGNPLLATFAVFVGLLVWCRLLGVVILVAAAWVAVTAEDEGVSLVPVSDEQRRVDDQWERVVAARRELEVATVARRAAPWYRRSRYVAQERRARSALVSALAEESSGVWARASIGLRDD